MKYCRTDMNSYGVIELSSDSEAECATCDVSVTELSDDDDGSISMEVEKNVPTSVKNPKPVSSRGVSFNSDQVRRMIKGGDWKKLNVPALRSYARAKGLIIGGTKQILIDRIKQHIEILEKGSEKYQPESFTINCTGDVCVGDVVKFKQMVYDNFNLFEKETPAGERIVTGRVVKESYGEKRQQHTFTVEVLRSSGYKALAPMERLQIKGRNLYKFSVKRQRWEDENMRMVVLHEKHERGEAARDARRRRRPLTGARKAAVYLDLPVGTRRRRVHDERSSEGGSAVELGQSRKRKLVSPYRTLAPKGTLLNVPVGTKRKRATLAPNGACKRSRPPNVKAHRGDCKQLMQKQAKRKKLPKHLSVVAKTKKSKASGQFSTGKDGVGMRKRTKAEKRREKRRRQKERRAAELRLCEVREAVPSSGKLPKAKTRPKQGRRVYNLRALEGREKLR